MLTSWHEGAHPGRGRWGKGEKVWDKHGRCAEGGGEGVACVCDRQVSRKPIMIYVSKVISLEVVQICSIQRVILLN